jgi:hypothetical protein
MENHDITKELVERLYKEKDSYLKRAIDLARYPLESSAVDAISAAFVSAQSEFRAISKDSQGYNYKYANLEDILSRVIPVLTKHGLALSQMMDRDNILHTRLRHESGQWFESQVKFIEPKAEEVVTRDGKTKNFMQAWGGNKTYIRRYEICALLGIQPGGEDDDAQ